MKSSNHLLQRKALAAITLIVFAICALFAWNELSLDYAQREFTAMLDRESGNYNENRVVLSSTNRREAQMVAEEFGGTLRITDNGQFAVINLPEGVTLTDIAENDDYRKYHDRIGLDYNNFSTADESIADDTEIRSGYVVEDPMYAQQTYIDYLNIGGAWDLTRGTNTDGEKVTVAIIDTGIDTDHPEFTDADGDSIISTQSYDATNDKVVDQYDVSVIEDTDGHGTAVAGIIAAQMNDVGIAGIAPDVELLVIKCDTDEAGEFKSSADIVFAIYYAIERDVDVINMSLGGGGSKDMSKALQLAVDSDIICVAAAGNKSAPQPDFPAAYDTVIAVGALEEDSWALDSYSNRGVDIVAPGTALTTAIEGTYAYQSGTSISAPMVTAAVALYKSQNQYITYEALKSELLAAGKDLGNPGKDELYGFGALDVNAFLCEEKGVITFDYCTEEIKSTTQVFVRRHTIQTVPEPERENIVFDGWYYDKAYTQVFDYDAWYSTEFVEDVTLYAKWVNEDDEEASVYNYRTLSDGTIEIVSYKGKRRYLTIPNEIDGKIVSSIGASAFADNTRIRGVIFPEGLVNIQANAFCDVIRMRTITFTGDQLLMIGSGAFYNCRSLRQMELPDSLCSIGAQAFFKCTSLRSLELPDSVQIIGGEAFSSCASISSVAISENSSLTSVGEFAFSNTAIISFYIPENVTADGFNGSVLSGCSGMRSVSVHPGNEAFLIEGSTLYNAAQTEIVYYPAALTGSYRVEDGVDTIGQYAFFGSDISGLNLNATVTIGDNAFSSTGKLSSVELPDTVTGLGTGAFAASSISQITLSENLTAISAGAFGSSKLSSIHIPANVKIIHNSAFSNCSYLQKLTFAENSLLDEIGASAFFECYILDSFDLPDSLNMIGNSAFSSCRSITSLTIPGNVRSVGTSAFEYCSLLQQVDFADGCSITTVPECCFAYCTMLETVNFSDGIEKLDSYAFRNNLLLRNLNFSESSTLTTVGDYCFYSCSALQTMQLPETVTNIGQFAYAFSGLNRAEISTNMESIGDGAFGACYLLTEITVDEANTAYSAVDNVLFGKDITTVYCVPASRTGSYTLPETVRVSAPYSFYYDKFLTAVILPQGLEDIQMNSFYSCSRLAGIEIPANVTNIGRQAFENCNSMASVTFDSGSKLRRLGIYTFVNCGVTEITIPASVEEIAQYVFYNCNDLTKVTFEENSALTYLTACLFTGTRVENVVFEEGSALTSLQAHAFHGANYLTSVEFGDAKITNVDNYAFYGCSKLAAIELPGTVTYIGRYAFYGCSKLERIDLPETVDYIGESAFYGTDSIRVFFATDELPANAQVDWDKGISGYFLGAVDYVITDEWEYSVRSDGTIALVAYKGIASDLTIDTLDGYTVTRIGTRCFYNNDTLTSVALSENITEIGNYAFYGCDGLNSIVVPTLVEKIGKYAFAESAVTVSVAGGSGLKVIDDYAFSGNATASLEIPDTVTEIGDGAFRNSGLNSLTIGETSTLEAIGEQAFMGTSITDIYMPASLHTVGAEAFKNVTSLTTVEIAEGDTVLKLSNSAFEGCGITEIAIPDRVGYIGEYTLGSCPNLQDIHVASGNTAYTDLDGVLCDINGTTLIQYPCGRSGAYEVPEQIAVLTYASFRNAKDLTEVSFAAGSTVRTIGWQMFSGCESLTKITVPDSVVSFDFYAFENCTALTDVILSEGSQLTGVYEGAFYGCTALKNIMLPDAVVEIGEYAFYNCSALTTFPLLETAQVKGIYDYAFYGCSGITEIPVLPQLVEIGEYAFGYSGIVEYTVGASVKDIASNAFIGCENFTNIFCDEANAEFTAIDGALYEKGSTGASDYEALIVWPYNKMIIIGEGKTVITAADTKFAKSHIGSVYIADTVTEIGDGAFRNHTQLHTIVIPDGVTSIGGGAFSNCTNLENVNFNAAEMDDLAYTNNVFYEAGNKGRGINLRIGPDVTRIPAGLFCARGNMNDGAPKLKNVVFHDDSVCTSIGDRAFMWCDDLVTVNLPESLEAIGEFAFWCCYQLENVQLPADLMTIGDYAFSYCKTISEMVIPDQILHVGNGAISRCDKLTSLTIGASVKTIGMYAFTENISLNSVIIPDSVETIGESAFESCVSLENVIVGESVSVIDKNAFAEDVNLRSITLYSPSVAAGIDSDSAYGALCQNVSTILIPQDYTVINDYLLDRYTKTDNIVWRGILFNTFSDHSHEWGCEKVIKEAIVCQEDGDGEFACAICGIWKEDVIPAHDIKETLFSEPDCTKRVSGIRECTMCGLTIEFEIPAIGEHTWSQWHEVTDDLEASGELSQRSCAVCGTIEDGAFGITSNGTCGEDITWVLTSDGTLWLNGEGAMRFVSSSNPPWSESSESIIMVEIVGPITNVADYAFSNCSSLQNIRIPDSVISISDYAFRGCTALTSITIPNRVTGIGNSAFYGCSSLIDINIPDGVTGIGNSAFYGCSSLTDINIPDGVTGIGNSAFYGCSSLTDINIPDGVTSIGSSAFRKCTGLTGIEIPDGVSRIESYTFQGCSQLTSAIIPDGVSYIGNDAFSGCSRLTEITIPGGVTSIGSDTFNGCSRLTSIIIPDGVTSIGGYAFSGCSRLTSVIIPDGVNYIGNSAFYGCSSLTSINIPDGVTSMAVSVFSGCSRLKSIVIPDGVTSIGNSAFYGCSGLTSINIPDGVTSIGDSAFYGCKAMTTIAIPSNVTSIGTNAFGNCSGLKRIRVAEDNDFYANDESGVLFNKNYSVLIRVPQGWDGEYEYTIPRSVSEIAEYAFYSCRNLTSVTIPDGVTSIGNSAFHNCTGLERIIFNATEMTDLALYNRVFDTAGVGGDGITVEIGANVTRIPAYLFFPYNTSPSTPRIINVVFEEGSVCESVGASAFRSCTYLTEITFTGNAPQFGDGVVFASVNATAYYPRNNNTWTTDVMQNYGGALVWKPVCTEHQWSEWTVVTEATCEQEGEKRRDCTICDHYETETILATGHSYESVVTDPTCTEEGFTQYTCATCGDSYVSDYVSPYGHSYDHGFCNNCGEADPDYEAVEIASGWSGATQWTLTAEGVLTFYGEGNMKDYGWGGNQPWAEYADQITSVVVENGVTAIGTGAFKDLTSLKSVTLPETGLKKIGEAAFYGCSSLKEIYIPDGVYTIWEYVFKNCTSLESVRLSKTLEKIDQGAFESCSALTELFLPTNVTIIGGWSFKACTSLASVDMQWTDATEIRAGAFKNCTALTEIILPSNIQKLGDSCFYGIGATKFTVPTTVTSIEPWCFARSAIEEIIFEGNAPTIGEGAFNKITLTACYPAGNATWTTDIMQNYGGDIVWKAN